VSELVTQDHLDWARAIAREKARGDEGLYQDLESAAALGLAQAARTWRPDGGASFRTHAFTRMNGAIADEMRKRDHLSRSMRQAVSVGLAKDPGPPAPLTEEVVDELVDPALELELVETAAVLRDAIHALPERERFVMWLRLEDELPLREIGQLLGVTESRVSQIATKALARLREQLAPIFAT
jgi:RNA polymerase sigma factor for flagellar operon FliA